MNPEEEEDTKMKAIILGGIVGLFFFALSLYFGLTMDLNGELRDCHTGDINKTIGETCLVDNSFDTRKGVLLFSVTTGFFYLISGILMGIMIDRNKEHKELVR